MESQVEFIEAVMIIQGIPRKHQNGLIRGTLIHRLKKWEK